MTTLRFDDLRQYSDTLRSRTGDAVNVRFVEPRDAEPLQAYFRSLTTRSRYNRFLGAMRELPSTLLEHFMHVGEAEQFSAVATMMFDGYENHRRRSPLRLPRRHLQHRIRPVDRRSLAGSRHRPRRC